MMPQTNRRESAPMEPAPPGPPDAPASQTQPPHATPYQRIGMAVLSLISLVFLLNIVAALTHDLGPAATAVGLAAVCLVVLGVNVAFNFDLLRRH